MLTVRKILDEKGHQFWHINVDSTVFEALQEMAKREIGALLVVDKEKLVGIFSERDYARKIMLHGLSSKSTKVGDFMSKQVIHVQLNTNINDCMALMNAKRIRHLPVLDDGLIVGVISIGDVLHAIIEEQHIVISNLENYIYGRSNH